MAGQKKVFRALTGISVYDDEDNEVKRYEAGDKIEDLDENDLANEIKAGNVEKWRERHTENVRTGEDAVVTGVVATHRDGQIVMKGVNE